LINVLNKGFVQIPVCDEDHMIINIVSQGFLVNIIAANIGTVQPAVVHNVKTIKQLNLIEKNKDRVFTIEKGKKVIEAVHIMHMVI
jgi:Mn-dependent DtxR family transcriptional regulator